MYRTSIILKRKLHLKTTNACKREECDFEKYCEQRVFITCAYFPGLVSFDFFEMLHKPELLHCLLL